MAMGEQYAEWTGEGFRHEDHFAVTLQCRGQRIGEGRIAMETCAVVGQHLDIAHPGQRRSRQPIKASRSVQTRQQAKPWPVGRCHHTRSSASITNGLFALTCAMIT
jgi:hypothetical protein